jgi:hypothetical protein
MSAGGGLVKLTRLNEAGNPSGEVWVNPKAVEAVVGQEDSASVRLYMTSGATHHVDQPQKDKDGKELPSVVSQLG